MLRRPWAGAHPWGSFLGQKARGTFLDWWVSEYPGLCWASSYTRFEVKVEFEVLIQVEL